MNSKAVAAKVNDEARFMRGYESYKYEFCEVSPDAKDD